MIDPCHENKQQFNEWLESQKAKKMKIEWVYEVNQDIITHEWKVSRWHDASPADHCATFDTKKAAVSFMNKIK